uniref:Putative DRNF1 n=1 Tax=Nostoc flagelliforme str. Sunitezuoqi TaxID=676037 RepID=J9WP68_9NOSO|nr:putative DRNF1 [Nostoc flagelliforme str. Sunitezuoqi]
MNFSADPIFQSSTPPPLSQTIKDLPEVLFTIKVTFDLALSVVNNFVFTKKGRYLSEAEIIVMMGAWDDDDYEEIANNSTYSLNYLQRGIAPRLWDLLSETIGHGERVGKKNLRKILEQITEEYYVQSAPDKQEKFPVNHSIEVKGRRPYDMSNFYGRTEELAQIKELIAKQRCVILVGVAGIGKSALATKLTEELSTKSQPRFDCLIWKSVAYAPSLQDLVGELLELVQSSEPELGLPKYTQAMISVLIKQLQSRRYLLILDGFEALFQRNVFHERLEYSLFFRRLIEELDQSSLLLTSRALPDEFDDLITAGHPIQEMKIEGLDMDAAMQLLSAKGLADKENCSQLIKIYRGNPSEMEAVVSRINRFFAGNIKRFIEKKTTFLSRKFETMLNQMFGQILSQIEQQVLIYIAEEMLLNSNPVSFTKLLDDVKQRQKASVSTLELIKAIEKLERQSLVESIKDPITKEISFNLQPLIKKYIEIDPLGLIHTPDISSDLAIAS